MTDFSGLVSGSAEAALWHDMFIEQIPVAEKILRTVTVYALIAVLSGSLASAGWRA